MGLLGVVTVDFPFIPNIQGGFFFFFYSWTVAENKCFDMILRDFDISTEDKPAAVSVNW